MGHSGLSGGLATGLPEDGLTASVRGRRTAIIERSEEVESKLATLQKDHSDLHAALFEASQVYLRLCAPRLVRHGNFEIASETFAARHLPGDFFTVEESSDGVLLTLGDISGKGPAAGMWTTLLLGLAGLHSNSDSEPDGIVASVNRDLCAMRFRPPLVTMFLAKLDPVTGVLDYCSAGHPPALLLRADGRLQLLSEGGPLLGAVAEAKFTAGRVQLNEGDLLAAYSDGLLEARNEAEQEFGFDRLQEHLRGARDDSAAGVSLSLLAAVQDFAGACPQGDDMSVVVIRRRRQ